MHLQINLIFRFLQSRQKVQIWLYEQSDLRIEGRIIVRFWLPDTLLSSPVTPHRQSLTVCGTSGL